MLYLSMLAIPAQGFAASTMLHCGPAHPGTKTAHEIEHHAAHGHPTTLADEHHGHILSAVEVDTTEPVAGAGESDLANGDYGPEYFAGADKSSCSACTSCCMGAAAMVSDRNLQHTGRTIERLTIALFHNTGFVTDGPRRPPRSFPA
ncbi:MAG: hypothetical protein JJE42_03825 [Burkholderiales bacterium]|nr:hypothetical protein [Burkholderiales bacterium]